MIRTEIEIIVNRKNDIDLIKKNIVDSKIQFPVYFMEYEFHYQIRLESDCEEWDLDTIILESFSEYEFITDLEKGRKEIRLQISRYQSELSTDGWGRPIENPLNETKYLIKKSTSKPERFSPRVKVLFHAEERNYYINVVGGIRKQTGELGFLLLSDFKSENDSFENAIKDRFYRSPIDAFKFGYYKMQDIVNQDFEKFISFQKKELTKLHKIPRKIVRNFIDSCNKSDFEGIWKNLDENVIFEKRIHYEAKESIEGLEKVKEYFLSQNQELLGKYFKIRSSWNIQLPIIEIGLKYYSSSTENDLNKILEYRRITFVIKNDKIIRIIENK
ncbi:hypothetical protein [Fluviicola chungangensis]|uniref:Uncharacterized protein n=1 Tax=Fluviicola chungangensis TaxID=2597671 RepID=A0A556MYB0_9FLAO|nr:hypothetical protein [Fluviicola chungangensis]TSJ44818.1 hypothetical protein FO442_09465 [Fluviicola chungangensis]